MLTKELLEKSFKLGADWMADVCQVSQGEKVKEANSGLNFWNKCKYNYEDYTGAVKSEYYSPSKGWRFYGTIWHTGQAVRAMVKAYKRFKDKKYYQSAIKGGEFIRRYQIKDKKDPRYGMILSFEDSDEYIGVSCTIESLMALVDLYEITKDEKWLHSFKIAVDWVIKNAYLPEKGLIIDHLHYQTLKINKGPWGKEDGVYGRPLNDDAVFGIAYQLFKDDKYKDVCQGIVERLLKDEEPKGNWIQYVPCSKKGGSFHIRQSWWWGFPGFKEYDIFGDERYLELAKRAANWYLEYQHVDGGFHYREFIDKRTFSYSLSTSGAAVAVIMWLEMWKRFKEEKYLTASKKSLEFILNAQLGENKDHKGLKGAFIETPLPSSNSGEIGFHIRDIATTFALRALDSALEMNVI